MKRFVVIILLSFPIFLQAKEGMWIPSLIAQLNYDDIRSMGLKLTAEDIYSVNHSSIKDAIVRFGNGCTAVIVSDEGLILTNHHCGFGSIQDRSSLEHDYLTNGFWAMNQKEEIPNPGLSVSLLVKIEDVTQPMLEGITPGMNEKDRKAILDKNTEKLRKEAAENGKYEVNVKAFYYGNAWYMMVYEVYKDIRLVGAPPSAIGKFGGDTDNWMWPRHGGDFSVFRIYAGKENKPAAYSAKNVPYKPKYFVPVSLKGVEKGDFTMVLGYAGTTREYLTSYALKMITATENPARIRLRDKRLEIIDEAMRNDHLTRLQYANKQAGIANGWKKMMGEDRGIKRLDGIVKKQQQETAFREWVESDISRKQQYEQLLPAFEKCYMELTPLKQKDVYLNEAVMAPDVMKYLLAFAELEKISNVKNVNPEDIGKVIGQVKTKVDGFFKEYNKGVDERIFAAMFGMFMKDMGKTYSPAFAKEINDKYKGEIGLFTQEVFISSFLTDQRKVMKFLEYYRAKDVKKLKEEKLYRLAISINDEMTKNVRPQMANIEAKIDSLQRVYIKAMMEMQPQRVFYPDANSTLRIAYGNVDDYQPRDAVSYDYFTTLDGVMEKEDTTVYDYIVNAKLKELWKQKDYGPYVARDGKMHVAFTGSNHTTGGNSGSPVLDANGNLIGLNFDRNWEGTMSDLMYDPSQCRNIVLDIRYCLFIIDKFAGAGHLVEEMRVVQ